MAGLENRGEKIFDKGGAEDAALRWAAREPARRSERGVQQAAKPFLYGPEACRVRSALRLREDPVGGILSRTKDLLPSGDAPFRQREGVARRASGRIRGRPGFPLLSLLR